MAGGPDAGLDRARLARGGARWRAPPGRLSGSVSPGISPQRRAQALERGDGRLVDPAVDPSRTEVALKGLEHELGRRVDDPRRLDGVAIIAQQRLELRKLRAGGADPNARFGLATGCWLDPMANAGGGEPPPGKFLTRVDLAPGCHV